MLAVVVNLEAERAGGITTVEPVLEDDGNADYASAQTLPVSGFGSVQGIWEENFNTASPWTSSEASAAIIGARFQA